MEGRQAFGQQALSLRSKAAIIGSLRDCCIFFFLVMLVILYNCEPCHIMLLALIWFMGVECYPFDIMATIEAFLDLFSVLIIAFACLCVDIFWLWRGLG